jgi:hypothetical protein
MSWQGGVALVAAVVAAGAACVALYFAWQTLADAAVLRRSTRSDRILDCIADYSGVLLRALDMSHIETKRGLITASRLRLEAAVGAVTTPHPKCRALASSGTINETSDMNVVIEHVREALEEATALHGSN